MITFIGFEGSYPYPLLVHEYNKGNFLNVEASVFSCDEKYLGIFATNTLGLSAKSQGHYFMRTKTNVLFAVVKTILNQSRKTVTSLFI